MNSSDFAGSRSWQSASLPGSEVTPSALLRVISRALRAASRAAAAWITLPTMTLASDGCSSSQYCSASLMTFSTTGRTSEETSLSLVWEENFGSGTLQERMAVSPSRQSSPVSATFSFCVTAALLGIAGDLARQRAAEAGEMGAAVALRDGVGEAEHGLVVAVVPPQRAFDRDALALGPDHDRGGNERGLVAVEIFDEGLDPALVEQLLALLDRVAHVGQHDPHAGIEEGELAQPVLQRREVELGHGEGARARQERHLGAALVVRGADHRQRSERVAVAELDEMLLAVAPDRELEPGRERVHHRDADAVQAARDLVGVLVEFPAGMQMGHDDLGGRDPFALVDVGRDAAAVVAHRAGAVRIERDHHLLGVAGERLVDGVVDHLVDHVVEARAVIGVADIHAGPLAHRVEALEDLDRIRVVVGRNGRWLAGGFGHGGLSERTFGSAAENAELDSLV